MNGWLEAAAVKPHSALYPLAGICVLALLVVSFDDPGAYVQEGGVIESGTVVGYGLVIAALLAVRPGDGMRFMLHSVLVVGLLAARELDLHKAFTTRSILSARLYTDTGISSTEKLVAAVVVLIIAIAVLRYFAHGRRLAEGLRASQPHALSLFVAVALVPISKVLDSAPRVFRDDIGVPLSSALKLHGAVFEEVLELGIPLMMLWALWQFAACRRRGRSLHSGAGSGLELGSAVPRSGSSAAQ